MTTLARRDDERARAGFASWCAHRWPDATHEVVELTRPKSGWANETVLVSITSRTGNDERRDRFVVRLPPTLATWPSYDLRAQARVLDALAPGDVPVPRVVALEDDAQWLGAPFLVMSHEPGAAGAEVPAFDPWLVDATVEEQRRLHESFVTMLASIHRVDWRECRARPACCGAARRRSPERSPGGRSTSSGPPTANRPRRSRLRSRGARRPRPTYRSSARRRRCAGAMPASATSSSADDRASPRCSTGSWRRSVRPRWIWRGTSRSTSSRPTSRSARSPGSSTDPSSSRSTSTPSADAVHDLAWHEIFALTRSVAINERQARLAATTGIPYPGVAGDENPVLALLTEKIGAVRALRKPASAVDGKPTERPGVCIAWPVGDDAVVNGSRNTRGDLGSDPRGRERVLPAGVAAARRIALAVHRRRRPGAGARTGDAGPGVPRLAQGLEPRRAGSVGAPGRAEPGAFPLPAPRRRPPARKPSRRRDPTDDPDTATVIAVRNAVARLPRRQRTALVLRYFADLSVARPPRSMHCPEGTVKTLTHEAIRALRTTGLDRRHRNRRGVAGRCRMT